MDTQSLVTNKRKVKATQLFLVAGSVLITLIISVICIGLTVRYEVDRDIVDTESIRYWKMNLPQEQDVWYKEAIAELRSRIMGKDPEDKMENVIIFITEGVNTEMLARARFMEMDVMKMENFIWDRFPCMGILKSNCTSDPENCDAFTLGTSLFGGVKTTAGLGGLDKRVKLQNCSQGANTSYHVQSIFKQAKDIKLRTGFVTTKRVTGPLISALYAHSSDTQWECDATIPTTLKSTCEDVATQLIKSEEGKRINVIMGGGRQTLVSKVPIFSKVDKTACNSIDKRNLLREWESLKLSDNRKYELLQLSEDLNTFKGSSKDYVLGVFANGNITAKGPKLKTMVTKSLDVLKRKKGGYVLVVESAVQRDQVKDFQYTLRELDNVIKESFKHPGYSTDNTLVLTVFLDIKQSPTDKIAPNDILVYATGPNAYLFHSIHEETYLAHVVSYSLQMGPFKPVKKFKKIN